MKRPVRLTDQAKDDIRGVWQYTLEHWNEDQADRYLKLIDYALMDLEDDPIAPGSTRVSGFKESIRAYRIALSRLRHESEIKSPRHVIIYTLEFDNETLVLRVLHDAMDFPDQLESEET